MDACNNNLSALGNNPCPPCPPGAPQNSPNFKSNVDNLDPRIRQAIADDPRIGFASGFSEEEIAEIIQKANFQGMPQGGDAFQRSAS